MFNDALIESSGTLTTRSKYYTGLGALLNGGLVAALILFPLLHPESLPKASMAATLIAPLTPTPTPPPQVHARSLHVLPSAASEYSPQHMIASIIHVGRDVPQRNDAGPGMPSVIEAFGAAAGAIPDLIGATSTRARPSVVSGPPNRVIISQGVMAGNILLKPEPIYPAIARAARVQGMVILAATISKTGSIEHLTVISGSLLLTQAALDAVQRWRYRPYHLNGEPVEVQTVINVSFSLGG